MGLNADIMTIFRQVEQLDNRTLDTFIEDVISLRVRRGQTEERKKEVFLLKKINKSLPTSEIQRFRALKERQQEEALNELEYAELLILLEKIEKLNVSRLKYLTQLAQLRHISVRELMQQLGIVTNTING